MYAPCSCCTENSSAGPSDVSVEELNERYAVRFFIKRSKRVDLQKQQMQQRPQKLAVKKEPAPECLLYLGLAPSRMKARDQDEQKEEKRLLDFEFRKPQVYECYYCKKMFFHKVLYRTHMIRHIRKIHSCSKCHRVFSLKALKKKHELICRH